MRDPNLDDLKLELRRLRKEIWKRGLPLHFIGKIKAAEAVVDEVRKARDSGRLRP